MRVIAGRYRGRQLKAVPGNNTRPTTDKVKEALFSMLSPYLDGGQVLDLFAGTGGLAIEAVSRGCDNAVLVDKQHQAQQVIAANIALIKDVDKFKLLKCSAQQALDQLIVTGAQFNLVFLDPPYRFKIISQLLAQLKAGDLLSHGALVVAETEQSSPAEPVPQGFEIIKVHEYGITVITIFQFKA